MLKVCRKGEVESGLTLRPEEDRALRDAFGRFGRPDARTAGMEIVRRYQHRGFGNWFTCDCLAPTCRPPVLVPVLESFVRRHTDPPWPQHADGCDFYRDPSEQHAITHSYARPLEAPRLLRGFGQEDDACKPGPPVTRCYSRRREALATFLFKLIEVAGINRVTGAALPDIGEQYRRLRAAAAEIELEKDLPLSTFFCTYPSALRGFLGRIAKASPSQFKRSRPHGIFLSVAHAVGSGLLVLADDKQVPVLGRISVFGERDGHGRDLPADSAARAPYLVICLVARARREAPVEILRAYAHPCVSAQHLMPVDSGLERRTLDELLRLRGWLRAHKSLSLCIEKPLFDLDSDVPQDAPREPCIPDFILTADGASGATMVLVETMGYADEIYRSRKRTIHTLMAQITGAPVLLHDFLVPANQDQRQRDRRFWLDARWTITGPEAARAR